MLFLIIVVLLLLVVVVMLVVEGVVLLVLVKTLGPIVGHSKAEKAESSPSENEKMYMHACKLVGMLPARPCPGSAG